MKKNNGSFDLLCLLDEIDELLNQWTGVSRINIYCYE